MSSHFGGQHCHFRWILAVFMNFFQNHGGSTTLYTGFFTIFSFIAGICISMTTCVDSPDNFMGIGSSERFQCVGKSSFESSAVFSWFTVLLRVSFMSFGPVRLFHWIYSGFEFKSSWKAFLKRHFYLFICPNIVFSNLFSQHCFHVFLGTVGLATSHQVEKWSVFLATIEQKTKNLAERKENETIWEQSICIQLLW